MSTNKDDKSFLIAPLFDGQRGPMFLAWSKKFLDAAEGKGNEDFSYADVFRGDDNAGGLSAAQTRRRGQNRREAYACILKHVTDDSLKAVIRAEAGPGVANAADRRSGRVAWNVLVRECSEPASALHINTKILEWHALSLAKDVGISESSITDFNRLLIEKNEELPQLHQFSDDARTEKLLASIVLPATLAKEADGLLQCPTSDLPPRFYAQAVVGPPAVPAGWMGRAVVQSFDELWRAAFKRGDSGLKFAAPTARPGRTGPSNRADEARTAVAARECG